MHLNTPTTLNILYIIAFLLCLLMLLLILFFVPLIIKSFKTETTRKNHDKTKQITCPIYNSKDFTQKDNMIVCDQCGCKYTIEEARKLLSK